MVQRKVGDEAWALPGGRVEIGERSADALVREFDEELALDVEVGERVAVLENFFTHGGKNVHSIEFYYRVTSPAVSSERIAVQESDLEIAFWTPTNGLEVRPLECLELLGRVLCE